MSRDHTIISQLIKVSFNIHLINVGIMKIISSFVYIDNIENNEMNGYVVLKPEASLEKKSSFLLQFIKRTPNFII